MSETPSVDARFMCAALAFGRRFLGETGSNPAVGALLVKDGVVIGRGATRPGGRPHAETQALLEAGENARGATLYVTLEPCSHHGQTPPCAEAVAAAGVARVVSALEDPDPRVSGRGHRLLEAAGLSLRVGVCAEAARRAHRGHILRVTAGRPMVTLKLAETGDGFAAAAPGDPRLRITDAAADARVHILRAAHDGILIGAGTARADDPLLTVRLPGLESRRPTRIALDSRATLSPDSRLAATARDHPTLLLVGPEAPHSAVESLRRLGIEVETAPAGEAGLDLAAALRLLARLGFARLLCEGGPRLASNLVLAGLADEAILFRSPTPLGRKGLPTLSSAARAALAKRDLWRPLDRGFAGRDQWESWERIE